jgi:voltage-gated potassium channel
MPGRVPFAELNAPTRRRLIAGAALRIALTTGSLLAAYYVLPLDNVGDIAALVYFLVSAAIFVSAMIWQVRSITRADHPGLRAVEAIGVALPLLVILFAVVYISLADADPANFSVQLSRSAGLYFTITVLSTVGFGDIVPKTDTARLVVSLQMLLDLVVVGAILKVIVGAARTGFERRQGEPESGG